MMSYLFQTARRRPPSPDQDVHLILCFADHYEPQNGRATLVQGKARVERWVSQYPRQFGGFRDSDGRTPRHTFFYPIDEYEPELVEEVAKLCRAGFGEIEIHLHHDGDTAATLRDKLSQFKQIFSEQHGMLARHRETGELAYGFIHGNWALCNSRLDGRWCGVNDELDVLRETGCYADFTLPSAPHATQTRKINSIYYASNKPGQPRSHDTGMEAGTARQPAGSLLLVQGPLLLNWSRRKFGIFPSLENGCIQDSQPASFSRVANWLRARIQVPTRPDWFFIKLHSHGAEDTSQDAMLGEPMVRFHQDLAAESRRNPRFHYHYVTAREMYNLIKAAESNWQESIAEALDFELQWNGEKPTQSRSLSTNHEQLITDH